MKQFLLEMLCISLSSSLEPEGCSFDNEKGYWVLDGSKQPFITSEFSSPPRSKKCDVETGEDQKGE